jgi:hypothetical protein
VKFSKVKIQAKFHKIPSIRLEDQRLTSFSGLLKLQLLIKLITLRQRLKKCFAHLVKLGNFSMSFIDQAMYTTLMAPNNLC